MQLQTTGDSISNQVEDIDWHRDGSWICTQGVCKYSLVAEHLPSFHEVLCGVEKKKSTPYQLGRLFYMYRFTFLYKLFLLLIYSVLYYLF